MQRYAICLSLLAAPLWAQSLSQGERDFDISALHASRKVVLDTLAQLSPAQLKWKPAPEVWCALEVAEHIVVTERTVPESVHKALAGPLTPEKRKPGNLRDADQRLLNIVPVRDQKRQAPEVLRPTGQFTSKEPLIAEFKRLRDANIAYIRETTDDLRGRFIAHSVLGEVDLSQWYLLLAAHADRHVNQIKELMANPNFPKN